MKLYRYKNFHRKDGTYDKSLFMVDENDIVYKMGGPNSYVVGSCDDVDINDLEEFEE